MIITINDLLECKLPIELIGNILTYLDNPDELTRTRNELFEYWIFFKFFPLHNCIKRLNFIYSQRFIRQWIKEKQNRRGKHPVILGMEGKKLVSIQYGKSRRYHWNRYFELDHEQFTTEGGRAWIKRICYDMAMNSNLEKQVEKKAKLRNLRRIIKRKKRIIN